MPYKADFEDPDTLLGWRYDSSAWQIVTQDGSQILLGQGDPSKVLVVLGQESPQWLQRDAANLAISFRFKLGTGLNGLRLVFRSSRNGYNAIEFFPGTINVKRNGASTSPLSRDVENIIDNVRGMPIFAQTWHQAIVWAEGTRITVYIDGNLATIKNDRFARDLGVLSAGEILFQPISEFQAVLLDDVVIQMVEPATSDFPPGPLPPSWIASDTTNVRVTSDGFLEIRNGGTVDLNLPPLADVTLQCEVRIDNGGYQLVLRKSEAGAVKLEFTGGHLTISNLDSRGVPVFSRTHRNVYNPQIWEHWRFHFVGDMLQVRRNGDRIQINQLIENPPPAGQIRFETTGRENVKLDSCLILEVP